MPVDLTAYTGKHVHLEGTHPVSGTRTTLIGEIIRDTDGNLAIKLPYPEEKDDGYCYKAVPVDIPQDGPTVYSDWFDTATEVTATTDLYLTPWDDRNDLAHEIFVLRARLNETAIEHGNAATEAAMLRGAIDQDRDNHRREIEERDLKIYQLQAQLDGDPLPGERLAYVEAALDDALQRIRSLEQQRQPSDTA